MLQKRKNISIAGLYVCPNSIFWVTTPQYCAYFTLRRFGLIIKPSKEKSNPFEKKDPKRIRKRPKPNHKKQAQKQNQKTKMEDIIMSKVVEFLKENPVQYLATVGRDGKAKNDALGTTVQ